MYSFVKSLRARFLKVCTCFAHNLRLYVVLILTKIYRTYESYRTYQYQHDIGIIILSVVNNTKQEIKTTHKLKD